MSKFKVGQFAQYRDDEEAYTILIMESPGYAGNGTYGTMKGVVIHREGFTIPDCQLARSVGEVEDRFNTSCFSRVKNPLKAKTGMVKGVGGFYYNSNEGITVYVLAVDVHQTGPATFTGVVVHRDLYCTSYLPLGGVSDKFIGGSQWSKVKNPLKELQND